MHIIFTVFDPREPEKVRFVGITTQSIAQRLKVMCAVARCKTARAYHSPLSTWLRSLSDAGIVPSAQLITTSEDSKEAKQFYNATRNVYAGPDILNAQSVSPIINETPNLSIIEKLRAKMTVTRKDPQ